jgi:acrylyl-CoA reductase (NADPH)
MSDRWNALVASSSGESRTVRLQTLSDSDLPIIGPRSEDVTVRVAFSSLNYKDGLAVLGRNKVIRRYPMVPGIDFSGTVENSDSSEYQPGDQVVLTGWGVGENHWGGFAQKARVPAGWLLPLPPDVSMKHAMTIGTAGLTAMLCLMALQNHGVTPESGPIVVTGAAGGVGSMAVACLSHLGYRVTACTGRPELSDYLRQLGASEIIGRDQLASPAGRPLAGEHWAGAIDVAGGTVLANLLSAMKYGSTVAACGLAADPGLQTTVLPFILRGVTLCGIDSVMCPAQQRKIAWKKLANCLSTETLNLMTHTITLSEVPEFSEQIVAGKVQGRIVVDVNS